MNIVTYRLAAKYYEFFKVTACADCQASGQLSDDAFLQVILNGQEYQTERIIPLALSQSGDYLQVNLKFNCTNNCYPQAPLSLAVRYLLRNIPQTETEECFGYFQDQLAVEYPFLVHNA